jgi:hypothetical protein
MLAPLWDLPIYRRGALPIDPELMEAIFDPASVPKFDKLLAKRISGMNAPFHDKKPTERELFEL